MKSILVPVPPEGRCLHLQRAIWLARQGGTNIILLCVAPQAQAVLDSARRDLKHMAPGISVRALPATGDPVHAILRTATLEAAEFIVMGLDPKWRMENGWSEERAFHRFLRKSTVARVVQEAPCPVWLDKPLARGGLCMPTLFCFLDMTMSCDGLVRFAARLAGFLGARMILFHCTMSAHIFGPGQSRRAVETQEELVAIARRKISRLQARCSTSAASIVTAGDDMSALDEAVSREDAGLIVIDRVSRRWGDNGKIHDVLRRCPASVLVRAGPDAAPVTLDQYAATIQSRVWAFLMLLSLAMGLALICAAIYLAVHTDNCHLAPIRCQLPPEFLFQVSPDFEN